VLIPDLPGSGLLSSLKSHNFHDVDANSGYLFRLRVIGEIYPGTFQAPVEFLATIFKRDVISVQHYRVEYPAILLALHVTHHSCHIELIEVRILS